MKRTVVVVLDEVELWRETMSVTAPPSWVPAISLERLLMKSALENAIKDGALRGEDAGRCIFRFVGPVH